MRMTQHYWKIMNCQHLALLIFFICAKIHYDLKVFQFLFWEINTSILGNRDLVVLFFFFLTNVPKYRSYPFFFLSVKFELLVKCRLMHSCTYGLLLFALKKCAVRIPLIFNNKITLKYRFLKMVKFDYFLYTCIINHQQ